MDIDGNRVLTYADLVKGLDTKGNFEHRVVDLVAKENEMLDDMCIIEANDGSSLTTKVRTETPTPTWTGYYHGIKPNKSSKTQIKVSSARLGAKIIIDKKLFDDAGMNQSALLDDEVRQTMEGMNIEMATMLIYGDIVGNPLGFNGLFKSYAAWGANSTKESAHYVFSALDAAESPEDTTCLGSIALVGWSPMTITAFHPQNSATGGIKVSEKRVADITDPDNGGSYPAYISDFDWQLGFAVRDFRYGGRIANIQRNLMLTKGKEVNYVELISRLAARVRENGVKQCWYMDNQMWENVCTDFYRLTRGNAITFDHIEARKVRKLFGIPVRIQEAMEVAEEVVPQFGV